jgi:branched-chain amino acid transport system ATP-binding protein
MLELLGVEGSYGGIRALRDFNISVTPGSTTALLGRNGAGKSTALKLMAGSLLPSAGLIQWKGRPIELTPPEERVKLGIALVPEGRGMFPGLTVEENLRIGAYVDKPTAKELGSRLELAYTRLPTLKRLRKSFAGRLSGGEQQMLTVARALMGNPKVLLLDEPSLGLAPKIVEELYEVFSELRDGVLAMVLVEQYVTYALDLCDHALVLENGEVVARGSGAELQATNALSEAYLG